MLTRYRPRTFGARAGDDRRRAAVRSIRSTCWSSCAQEPARDRRGDSAALAPRDSNYSSAWSGAHLGAAMLNSTIITVISLLCLIMVGSTAAYYLARTTAKLSYGMYLLFLLGIVLPFQLALVPLYRFMGTPACSAPTRRWCSSTPACRCRSRSSSTPGSCARCRASTARPRWSTAPTHWQSFTRVTFPLLRPITGTVMILNAVFIWNDFLTPLLYLGGTAERDAPGRRLPVRRPVRLQLGLHLRRGRHGVAPDPGRLPAPAALRDQGLRQRTEGLSHASSRTAVRAPRGHPVHRRPGAAPELAARADGAQRQTALPDRRGTTALLWDSGGSRLGEPIDVAYGGPPLPSASELRTWTRARSARGRPPVRRSASRRAFAPVSPSGPRPGSAAIAATTRRCPSPATRRGVDDDDAMLGRLSAVPLLAPRVPAARATWRGRRCTPRARGLLELGGQRRTRRRRGAGAGLDRLPRADRVRGARRDRAAARGRRTCSARSSATAGTPGMVGFDARRPGNHYGRELELLCELHLEYADGSREVVASDEQLAGDAPARCGTRTC